MARPPIPRKWLQNAYDRVFGRPEPEQPPALERPPEQPTVTEEPMAPVERPTEPQQMDLLPEEAAPPPTTDGTPLDPNAGPASRLEGDVEQRIDDAASYDVAPELLRGRERPRRNINLDFFDDTQTRAVLDMYNQLHGVAGADTPGRRVVTHQEILDRTVGVGDVGEIEAIARMRKILAGDINEKWSPEDLLTSYRMLEQQGGEIQSLAAELAAKRREGATLSTEDLAEYQLLESRFVALMEIVSTRTAETGRMLNSLKALQTEGARDYARTLRDIVKTGGGESQVEGRILLMAEADPQDLEAVAKMSRDSFTAKTWDALIRVRYNFMLSSLRTHAANIAGSSSALLYETLLVNPLKVGINNMEYFGRAAAQYFFNRGGMAPEDRMLLSEVVSVPYHTIGSAQEAMAVAYRVAKGEALGHGKIMNEHGMRVDRVFSTETPSIGGFALDTPTRLIEAEDALFRTMHINSKIRQLAQRRAVTMGRTAEEVNEIYNQLVRNPPESFQREAYEYAAKHTFTNDPSVYGRLIGGVAEAASTFQDYPVGRVILPFVRTPANLTGYTIESLGLQGVVAPRLFLEQLTSSNPEVRADAMARATIAAGLFVMSSQWYEEGKITGMRPKNNGIARSREAAGWRANAVKIGDEYYELNRLDPVGLTLGALATVHDVMAYMGTDEQETAAVGAMITIASLITDRSMLSGFGELSDIFTASEYTGPRRAGVFAGRTAASFIVPSIVRDIRQMNDPYQRSQHTVDDVGGAAVDALFNAIVNAAPGWSEQLPPAVNAFGEDQMMGGDSLFRAFIPMNRQEVRDDPVGQAWIALGISNPTPGNKLKLPGILPEIDLLGMDGHRGWVYREYARTVQQERYRATQQFVNSSAFKRAVEDGDIGPNSDVALALQRVLTEAGNAGKLKFFRWLEGRTSFEPVVGGEPIGERINITPVDRRVLAEFDRALRGKEPSKETMEQIREHDALFFRPRRGVSGMPEELRLQREPETPRQPVQRPEF